MDAPPAADCLRAVVLPGDAPPVPKSAAAPQALPEGAVPLAPAAVRWSLEALGSEVSGTIEVDFEPVPAESWGAGLVGAWRDADVVLEVEGMRWSAGGRPLVPDGDRARPRERGRPGSAPDSREPGPSGLARIAAGTTLTWTARVHLDATRTDGVHELVVPRVASGCADGGEPATTVTLDVLTEGGAALERSVPDGAEAREDGDGLEVTLLAAAGPRGDDVVLAWRPWETDPDGGDDAAGADAGHAAWATPLGDGTTRVSLVLSGPAVPRERASGRASDVVFVVDASGSMQAEGKLTEATSAVASALRSLPSGSRFDVVAFANEPRAWSGSLRPALESEAEAGAWLRALAAGGGTRLTGALEAALSELSGATGHPLVVVLTDGAISDEDGVARVLDRHENRARLLFVAIGRDARRDVLRRLTRRARGGSAVADPADVGTTLARLLADFASPVAWDLSLDWGGARAIVVDPARLPDLHAGRSIAVRARVEGELPGELRVSGTAADGPFTLSVPVRER